MTKKAAAARKAGAARRLEAAARDQKVSLVRAPGATAPANSAPTAAPATAPKPQPAAAPKPQPAAAPRPQAAATAPRPGVKRPAAPPPAPPTRAVARATSTARASAANYTPRARSAPPIAQQYSYVAGDLRLIAVLATLMFVVIIALHFYLPS